MQIILCQRFPSGRFHATPWKVFSYDDPHGEWPPSPWRLLRAILARSYQLEREQPLVLSEPREALASAFCQSEISWHLSEFSWRGPGLRQYQPVEFKWNPGTIKKPGERRYGTSKVQDNFWLTPGGDSSGDAENFIWWFLSGDNWNPEILDLLDACLARMTYFGRAESITEVSRVRESSAIIPLPNCAMQKERGAGMVPVLAPVPDATLEQIQARTDDPVVADSTLPPGARWYFAQRPQRIRSENPRRPVLTRKPAQLLQFAIGARVSPQAKDVVRLTQRFRGRVLKALLKALTGGEVADWKDVPASLRNRGALMTGKDAEGNALPEHRHAVFFLHLEDGKPVRLCVWRREPFDGSEQAAMYAAAESPLPLGFKGDPWTVTLVPLDSLVPPPPALASHPHLCWGTLTPFVPPRHVYDNRGRVKSGESVEEQVCRELENHGVNSTGAQISVDPAGWVAVHLTGVERGRSTNADKLGFHVTIKFPSPRGGPIFLGASSHFGLGVFVPRADPPDKVDSA